LTLERKTGKKSIYIAPFTVIHSKGSGVDHTVLPAINATPAFPSWAFTRCHYHSNCGSGHPIAADYSFIDPERMKGSVGLVGWPIVDGLRGHPSATSRAQDSESTSAKDRCSTAGPREFLPITHSWCTLLYTLFTDCGLGMQYTFDLHL